MVKIGLLGFDFNCPNKGCEALSYTFIDMLSELVNPVFEVNVFSYADLGVIPQLYPNINFVWHRLHMKNPICWMKLLNEFNNYTCIFDITYGDGFSDIYGKIWNANTNMAKQIANMSKAPLVLLPQTYGPYKNKLLKNWAVHIVKKATLAFSRDKQSADEMKALGCNNVITATDLAFALPYNVNLYSLENNKIKIGLNVSSLLWDGGHNIKLMTDYRDYCRKLISNYESKADIEIYLIPHVIDLQNSEALENDSRVCKLLHAEFPFTVLAPDFNTPVEAKSYICHMDVFIGARMHATIGAVSSGVPTIPFAYSKKFKSLFSILDYPYVIEARDLSTDESLNITIQWINSRSDLKQATQRVQQHIVPYLDRIKSEIKALLS